MNRESKSSPGGKNTGIRLSVLNIVMICIGLVLATLMAVSMYRTTDSVQNIVSFTNNYLTNQQAGGMLRDFAAEMGEQAEDFVRTGNPGSAKAYEARMNIINEQLDQYDSNNSASVAADEAFSGAVEAFRARNETEWTAMRLVADTLPEGAFAALPAFLQEFEPDAGDKALSADEKKEKAISLLTSETYTGLENKVRTAVDSSHRLSSQEGKRQADESFTRVKKIVSNQFIMVLLFVAVGALALLMNRMLIISPIRKSVENLDRREPIPEQGSYEMRHLARVYNDVLKENQEKTEELSYTATHDALTGVFNRTEFDRYYRQIEKLQNVGIIVVDVDHFKQYNDDFGHDVGDRVLCTAVEAMKRHFRTVDHISRIGGDEFCVIMPRSGQQDAATISGKIHDINRELSGDNGDLPPVTISAGVAFWNRPNPEGSLFKDADTVLLDMKKTREDCCAVWGGIG